MGNVSPKTYISQLKKITPWTFPQTIQSCLQWWAAMSYAMIRLLKGEGWPFATKGLDIPAFKRFTEKEVWILFKSCFPLLLIKESFLPFPCDWCLLNVLSSLVSLHIDLSVTNLQHVSWQSFSFLIWELAKNEYVYLKILIMSHRFSYIQLSGLQWLGISLEKLSTTGYLQYVSQDLFPEFYVMLAGKSSTCSP